MTNAPVHIVLILAALVPACAPAVMPEPKAPIHYMCDDAKLVSVGNKLDVQDGPKYASNVQLGWADDDGRHYVQWPTSVTDKQSVEYVLPADDRADAIARHYDTRQGTAKQDWLLINTSTCTAQGGYSDALDRFTRGATMEEIQKALSLRDKAEARRLVHDAMINLQRRYWKDR